MSTSDNTATTSDKPSDQIESPFVGQTFPSEESAKLFYESYANKTGFVMRVMGCRKSEVDGRILGRRLGCNKEGFCVSENGKKKRGSSREGCKAMILVKCDKNDGIWVVSKVEKHHNHPLVVAPREVRYNMDIRDRKIQELNSEIRNRKRLCAIYQDQLTAFMKEVEDHGNQLSKKVQTVVKNLKKFGPLEDDILHHE